MDDTKNKIEEAALKLFYDKGYLKTSIEDIAKEAGIYKTSIQYYYQTKVNLASIVYYDLVNDRTNIITQKLAEQFGHYDMENHYGIGMYIGAEVMQKDEKARRFYYELCTDSIISLRSEKVRRVPLAFERKYSLGLDLGFDEAAMIGYSWRGANIMLFLAYYDGMLECTWEEYVDYTIYQGYLYLHYPRERIKSFLTEYKKVLKQIDYKILPYFKIE